MPSPFIPADARPASNVEPVNGRVRFKARTANTLMERPPEPHAQAVDPATRQRLQGLSQALEEQWRARGPTGMDMDFTPRQTPEFNPQQPPPRQPYVPQGWRNLPPQQPLDLSTLTPQQRQLIEGRQRMPPRLFTDIANELNITNKAAIGMADRLRKKGYDVPAEVPVGPFQQTDGQPNE